MKLNYYTYTIKFTKKGKTRKVCIKDIVDIFCQYQTNRASLVKVNKVTEKELYFAKADSFDTVYYLMTPTDLHEYRSLNKTSGTITDLKTLIGTDSLEKVTYVHIDDKKPVIGIASSRGGATFEDLEFYLNEVLNGLSSDTPYEISLKPLKSGVDRQDVKKLKMITQAKVVLDSGSGQMAKFAKLLTNNKASNNLEIEVTFKRSNAQANSIEKDIEPLLSIIETDSGNNEFVHAYFRGKRDSLSEQVKDMYLDHSLVLYDMIVPKVRVSIEEQIEVKRYSNQQVDTLTDEFFASRKKKLKDTIPCTNWDKLKDAKSY
ncbi:MULTISPECIES: hypothetical protein [Vibrio]|uniref:hypothetical protein n=1 Tax=Vibrio TaxID=662 RepID=UPI0005F22E72|nr:MULTISPECIES: hypothetical protein [Vibrio]MBE4460510.1 hypothetical protein [Vibrio parahaemolyticus]MCX8905880.1 hypothetical protein [Vibrio parahaemolyticus]MDN4717532.1 hypothetical protein [Vibrio parahaemolyticus]MDN4725002.1 hypothetical protein [Vibrio parahaemolyticus]MDN4729653.1 hypothetical protein [Vibrio parahaemolyticus]